MRHARRHFSILREASPSTLKERIVKRNGEYCVESEDGSRSFGCFKSEAAAHKRLGQVEFFKRQGEGVTADDMQTFLESVLTVAELRETCPNCAAVLESKGLKNIKVGALLEQARDPNAVCGALWFRGTPAQREAFGGGTEGRGVNEKPPKAWFDDCLSKITASKVTASMLESKFAPTGRLEFIREAERDAGDPRGSLWEVGLISVGISENKDPKTGRPRHYSERTLKKAEAEKIFEGKAAHYLEWRTPQGDFATHAPDGVPISMFPRTKVGWYEGVHFGNWVDSKGNKKRGLKATFHLVEADLRASLVEAWDKGNRNFLELSINAGGIIEEAIVDGIPVADVIEIQIGESVDLVTEGAMGGEILRLVASKSYFSGGAMNKIQTIAFLRRHYAKLVEGKELEKMSDADLAQIVGQAIKEQGPAVKPIEGKGFCIVQPDGTVGECFVSEELANEALAKLSAPPATEGAPPAGQTPPPPAATPPATQPATTPAATMSESAVDRLIEKRLAEKMWPATVEALLTESKLPADQVKHIRESFANRTGDRKSLIAEIDRTKKLLGVAADAASQQTRLDEGFAPVAVTEDKIDKLTAGLRGGIRSLREGLPRDQHSINKIEPIRSLRKVYEEATGDHRRGLAQARRMLEGVALAGYFLGNCEVSKNLRESRIARLKEALTTASWPQILGDALEKERLDVADAEDVNKWRKLGPKVVSTDNLYQKKRIRLGGYGTMPVVAEGAAYVDAGTLTDQQVQIDLAKRGFTDEITIEMMLRDELDMVAEIPNRMVRAGMLTLQQNIFDILVNNEVLTFDDDVLALFHVNHANINTNAMARAQILAGIEAMMNQLQYGSAVDRLGEKNMPDVLLVDVGQWDQAHEFVEAPYEFGTANKSNASVPSNIRKALKEVVVISHTTDLNDWFMVNSKGKTIEVDFLDGMEKPELFVQDMPNVGSMFTADKVTYKSRFWWGRAVLDYRPFYGGVVA
jgi:hypothetical protein